MTAIGLLQRAADSGLKLGFEPPNTLTVDPARLCSPEFAARLKAHKSALLALLRSPFVMVFSEIFQETIFFCEHEAVKAALIEAGAELFSIYTKDDLRILVAHDRATPFLPDQLRKLHEVKRGFNGTLRP